MAAEAQQVRLVTALLLVAIFAAGVGTGAAVCRWVGSASPAAATSAPERPPMPPPWHALDLTPEQKTQALAIAERYRPQVEAVVKESFPRIRALHERMRAELREVLTPEQQKQLEELEKRPPPFPPPPGGPPPGGPPPPFPPPF